jgi:Putative Actinobacterial Holin-X, holin superfamily III
MDTQADPYAEPDSETAVHATSHATLGDDLRQLIDDGRALAAAELAWQKSRAAYAGKQAGGIAVLGLLAAALVFCALMALTFGLVLALTPLLSAWGAMGAVVAGLLLAALIAGGMAAGRWRRVASTIAEGKAQP